LAASTKNHHRGFQVIYLWGGSRRRFLPDFVIRLINGKALVLEVKGDDSSHHVAKRDASKLWIEAINAKGAFGATAWDVAFKSAEFQDILARNGRYGRA
jgi:type III restriction enzyme